MAKRSDLMTKGPDRAPHRSLFKALGLDGREIERPMIGIANSANEIIPGHLHLHQISEAVKAGIPDGRRDPVESSRSGSATASSWAMRG